MSETKEILRYSSLLPEKKKSKSERENAPEPIKYPGEEGRKSRVRVGRGRSGRRGKTCGRGQKGQKSRSGYSRRAGFEGGQMPLHRRLPKRGFTSIFKKEYQVINLGLLAKAGLTGEVTPEILSQRGLISSADKLVKVLGHGELSGKIDIAADAFSQSAKKKIEAASGSCTIRKKERPEAKSKAE